MPLPATQTTEAVNPKLPYLGARLRTLYQWVESAQAEKRYENIWDCCCDHGYLGVKILAKELCEKVYFVDQVPHLMENLQHRLTRHFPADLHTTDDYPADRYQVLTADASQLRFQADQHHLIIIAGVGGEHSVDIVSEILKNHPSHDLDFLFCPTTTQFDLREYLADNKFDLLSESLVTEKDRDYEVIGVRWNARASASSPISKTGEHWDSDNAEHRRYLEKLITHYQFKTLGNKPEEAKRKLGLYQAIWDQSGF